MYQLAQKMAMHGTAMDINNRYVTTDGYLLQCMHGLLLWQITVLSESTGMDIPSTVLSHSISTRL